MYVATSKQLKLYDQALLNSGYNIEELVDLASDQLLKHLIDYDDIVIVSGPGNNGADGVSLALKLNAKGKKVKLYIVGEFERLSPANHYYLNKAKEVAISVKLLDEMALSDFEERASNTQVVVDAIFGFGLNSELRGVVKNIVEIINTLECDIISVDIPTGLNPDNGVPYNICVCATKTITLTALKLAFLNEESKLYTGEVVLELLSVTDLRESRGIAKLTSPSWVKYNFKERNFFGHKGDYGKILHITGCNNYRGAALLASRASVMSGSGIVSVYSTDKVIDALTTYTPECISTLRTLSFDRDVLEDKDALLIGSGLGISKASYDLVYNVLNEYHNPIIIDGDALTIVSQNMDWLENHQGTVILTPHIGEFKRFVDFKNEGEMVEAAHRFVVDYDVILVLKGPNTIICNKEEMYRNPTANKAMATAGMGDVLAGIITSLVGQGYDPFKGAIIGTYLHGLCGDIIAKDEYTVIPSKLVNIIPQVMNEIITKVR